MSAGHKKGSSARASSRQTNNSNSRKAQDETPPTDLTKVGYVVCPVEKRSSLLFTFLKKNQNNKVVVLFNSTTSAKYHSELFGYLGLETTFIDINEKRLKVAKQFRCAAFTVLCRYDLIGKYEEATVLDRCVLYEPVNILPKIPDNSLVVLQPYETGFLDHLKRLFPVETEELKFAWTKIADVQPQIEKLVSETYSLNTAAREAFKDYLRGYNDLEPKGLFNVKNIELKKLCLSFGLKIPVAVDLTDADKNVSERRVKRKGSEGYAYYVANVKGSGKSEYRQIEEAKKMKIYKPIKNKRRRLK